MKKFLLLLSIVIGNAIYADEMVGLITQIIANGGLTTYLNAPYYIARQSYAPGGITFTFDSGLFPQTPYVFVSFVYTPSSLGSLSHYNYSLYNLSTGGVTVKVYDVLGLEVGSSLVDVYLFAICQDPDGQSILVN